MKTHTLLALICFSLLAPLQADDKDKSDHTITLVCDLRGYGGRPVKPTLIDLNAARGMVTIHFGGWYLHAGEILPGDTVGPLKAHFTKNTITFTWVESAGGYVNDYTINRLTEIVDVISKNASGKALDAANHYQLRSEWTCHVGEAQF